MQPENAQAAVSASINADKRIAAQQRAIRAARSELPARHLAAACGANTKARTTH